MPGDLDWTGSTGSTCALGSCPKSSAFCSDFLGISNVTAN